MKIIVNMMPTIALGYAVAYPLGVVGMGAAAHGIGTARAIEMGAVEGALSGLAMALMGLATALLMPLMERYLY